MKLYPGVRKINILTGSLNVDEVHIVSSSVNYSPEEHAVRDLAVEPDIFVGREGPSEFRTDNPNYIAQHGQQDETTIISKDESSTTRNPDGEFEGVQPSQFLVSFLEKDIRRCG